MHKSCGFLGEDCSMVKEQQVQRPCGKNKLGPVEQQQEVSVAGVA